MRKLIFYLSLSIGLCIVACKKESFTTDPSAQLSVSTDRLEFDTLFTSIGSVTKKFSIRNENKQKIKINTIQLGGGNNSYFKTNINGTPAASLHNVEINGGDSIHVFVQITIDPSAATLPFIIQDSIHLFYNGNEKKIQLEAWGQNARFFGERTLTNDEVWDNSLPYVLLGEQTIPAGKKLTLEAGTRIYLHANAPILVNGTLEINGEVEENKRVYFTGLRQDAPYNEYPASWPGIYFLESSIDNKINYAVINNAYQAIGLAGWSNNTNPKLVMNNCIIDNAYDAGIIALQSEIEVNNTLISNCGKNIHLSKGGIYQFNHVTAVSIDNRYVNHNEPVLTIDTESYPILADFTNCIFWGTEGLVKNEVDIQKENPATFEIFFSNTVWRMETEPAGVSLQNIFNISSPFFEQIDAQKREFNFRLKEGAIAIDKGVATSLLTDLDGNPRNGLPDIGCFERQ